MQPRVSKRGRVNEGAPTLYRPEYCERLIEFFDKPSTKVMTKTVTLKSGTVIEEEYDAPEKPSHVVDFCIEIGIRTPTFYEWIAKYPQFASAYAHSKAFLERNIVDNALLNNYNAGFASLVAKNWLGWTDKQDVTSGGERIEPLQIYLPQKLTEQAFIDGEVVSQPSLDRGAGEATE